VKYLSQHRWAGQLDAMISQVVAEELENSVVGLYATSGDSPDADYNLEVTILQFVLVESGGVALSLEYRLANAETKDLIKEGRISRSSDKSGLSVKQSIALLEENLREAVREIAGQIN